MIILVALLNFISAQASAGPSMQEVKKHSEQEVRQVVEPVLNQYCHEQCQIIHVETDVDLAIDEVASPGFEESSGKATLAPASGKIKILVDESLGTDNRNKIVGLLREHLEVLGYPVQVDAKVTKFPQPVSSSYRVADLRDRVTRDIKNSLQGMISQFCPNTCLLGEFEVQTEVVSPEEVNYSSSQEYFQDGPAAIRVRGVKATLMTDQSMPPEETNGVTEMARLKVAQYKNSQISVQTMKFPKPAADGTGAGRTGTGQVGKETLNTDSKESKESKDSKESKELRDLKESKTDNKSENVNRKESQSSTDTKNNQVSDNRKEKFEHYEKIERVENGDAVQQTLEKFRLYGIILAAIVLALLITLVAISFRKQIFESGKTGEGQKDGGAHPPYRPQPAHENSGSLTSDEKAVMLGRRIEADRYFTDLTNIFSEQPKVAKHVFTHVLTEEGVETTAQYLEIFGESVVMDLLRDPGLQSDLSELMDFYARNTFDINEEERLLLLKKLHHRTVTAKMQVHGSRSAALFDFLAEMDAPQVVEMIKNESNTVKAIVLTQCDQKKRQALFNSHDEITRIKLMTELSRIDHLPKTYIYNIATALRRKKMENPKLNTEALPGTDVLVSFLEKSNIDTQRTIVQQLMSAAGAESLENLKTKLVSIETLRFIKEQQLVDVIMNVKHEELVQFLKGCGEVIKQTVLSRAPRDLALDLTDGLSMSESGSRDAYLAVERKLLNRMKVLANNGQINIAEVNERIFSQEFGLPESDFEVTSNDMRKVG